MVQDFLNMFFYLLFCQKYFYSSFFPLQNTPFPWNNISSVGEKCLFLQQLFKGMCVLLGGNRFPDSNSAGRLELGNQLNKSPHNVRIKAHHHFVLALLTHTIGLENIVAGDTRGSYAAIHQMK